MRHLSCLLAMVIAVTLSYSVRADLTLPAYYSDHMVLQREITLAIWGKANAGEEVIVSINGQTIKGTTKPDGEFIVELSPLKAGGPYTLTIETGDSKKTFNDVLVGDVWVCSGQSNMWWPLHETQDGPTELQKAEHPQIRLITIASTIVPQNPLTMKTKWVVCNGDTARNFSAVGYYFARELQKTINIPIGLVNASYGGTPAEAWTSKWAFDRYSDELKPILDAWDASDAKYDAWIKQAEELKQTGQAIPTQPAPPSDPRTSANRPMVLFNSMIAPITRMPIKGVIWYQGESNTGQAWRYRFLFPALIKDWRNAWSQGDTPFLWVQLAAFGEPTEAPGVPSAWAELREAQSMTLRLPNTGMATAIDIGDAKDIHPRNKLEVGRRLSLVARKRIYGEEDLVASGPIWDHGAYAVEDGAIRLKFTDANDGLVTRDGGPVTGFAIAGKDKKWYWADAVIDSVNTVKISSSQVPKPFVVRYSWGQNPKGNLMNKAGLPALPFRTDEWDGITKPKDR